MIPFSSQFNCILKFFWEKKRPSPSRVVSLYTVLLPFLLSFSLSLLPSIRPSVLRDLPTFFSTLNIFLCFDRTEFYFLFKRIYFCFLKKIYIIFFYCEFLGRNFTISEGTWGWGIMWRGGGGIYFPRSIE